MTDQGNFFDGDAAAFDYEEPHDKEEMYASARAWWGLDDARSKQEGTSVFVLREHGGTEVLASVRFSRDSGQFGQYVDGRGMPLSRHFNDALKAAEKSVRR